MCVTQQEIEEETECGNKDTFIQVYIYREKKRNVFSDYNCPVELCLRLVEEVAVVVVVESVENNKSVFHIDSDEHMLLVVVVVLVAMDQT
jgi:hypothetical protein